MRAERSSQGRAEVNDKIVSDFGPRYAAPTNPVGYGNNGYPEHIETCDEGECEKTFTKRSPNQHRCDTCQAAAEIRMQKRAAAKTKKKKQLAREAAALQRTRSEPAGGTLNV